MVKNGVCFLIALVTFITQWMGTQSCGGCSANSCCVLVRNGVPSFTQISVRCRFLHDIKFLEPPEFVQGVFVICEANHGSLLVDIYKTSNASNTIKVETTRSCRTTPVAGKTEDGTEVNHATLWNALGTRFIDLRDYSEDLISCPLKGVVSIVSEDVETGEKDVLASCRPGMEAHVVSFNMTKCPRVAA